MCWRACSMITANHNNVKIRSNFAGPPPALWARYASFANVSPFVPTPVVISRKLNKIGPLLLWKTIRKFTSLILLLPADPPTDALPCGDIRVSNKIVFKYYWGLKHYGFLFDLASNHSHWLLLSTECDRRNVLFTIIVLCWQHPWHDTTVE